ncbi:PREDICTED: anillin-like isoform X2 [Branchiostoma belcheri]|uniref:Anillin n=1 Tax=Branchiostoma belcheri TaxID=7741 RepID=A0A6P4Z614_BRABE|nr:PREDICTED: anillin-like isoform X2 [Branchiostoma belcheri]
MDPFTEKLLERTRQRRELLAQKMAERPTPTPRKRMLERMPLRDTENVQDNQEEDSPNKKPRAHDADQTEAKAAAVEKLLGKSGGHGEVQVEQEAPAAPSTVDQALSPTPKPRAQPASASSSSRGRFAHLAAKQNSWEDDTHNQGFGAMHREEKKKQAPKAPVQTSVQKRQAPTIPKEEPQKKSANTGGGFWGGKEPRLSVSESKPVHKPTVKTAESKKPTPAPASDKPASSSPFVSGRAALFDKQTPKQTPTKTVKETKAPVKTSQPPSTDNGEVVEEKPVSVKFAAQLFAAQEEKAKREAKNTWLVQKEKLKQPAKPAGNGRFGDRIPAKEPVKETPVTPAEQGTPANKAGPATKSVHDRLREAAQNRQRENDPAAQMKKERQAELAQLKNRWEKWGVKKDEPSEETTAAPKTESAAPCFTPWDKPKQRQQKQEPEPESEEDSEEEEMSGVEESSNKPKEPEVPSVQEEEDDDEEEEDEEKNMTKDLDDLLDEVIDSPPVKDPTPPRKQEPRRQEPRRQEPRRQEKAKKVAFTAESTGPKIPKSSSAESVVPSSVEEVDERPLMYSLECYRSMRKSKSRPNAVKTIVRNHKPASIASDDEGAAPSPEVPARPSRRVPIKDKVKHLMEQVSTQQTIVHQASQALNVCRDAEHGKGSAEEVEAERLLLIATQRRLALLAETQRLKNLGPDGEREEAMEGAKPCRGTLTITDIKLPLKGEFLFSLKEGNVPGDDYFFCLIYNGPEKVIPTMMLSTADKIAGDSLWFTNHIVLNDINSNFDVKIEVYNMRMKRLKPDSQQKSALGSLLGMPSPKLKNLAPKKIFTNIMGKDSSMSPLLRSLGGPSAVRNSSFVLMGETHIRLCDVRKTQFTLDKVPFLSPLQGHVQVRIHCHMDSGVEERGFLTMFQDVGGFGSWHRRWCVLSNWRLAYWTYPDDERRKDPIGVIDVGQCITKNITTVSREWCARPNTIEILCSRPVKDDDKDTIVDTVDWKNKTVTTKHWISADTKDERIQWIAQLNKALTNLRMWSAKN